MLTSQDAASSSTAAAAAAAAPISPPPAGAGSYNPSLLIIAAILIFVIAASASIHLLLRLLSRPSRSPTFILNPNSTSTSTSTSTSSSSSPSDHDPTALIASLPLSTEAAARFSGDCAVCLSRLRPHNRLRILPACSHAFHPACIDAWLRSSPSCPLCRSQITTTGLVIRTPDTTHPVPPPIPRTFSIGSEEEDIESVVARVTTGLEDAAKEENHEAPAPPGEAVAMEAGGGRGGWLKDYVDRLASSASSSFSSMRRGSLRSGGGGRESWDLEDGGGHTASLYRWLSGLSS
ncbi:hypothetical protein J5N97_025140 [Dioscorea zingiberensis]|uniref:RING-type domain-containing protein n=1 Tax=Dioscorea zingiberensis TaxID=325984 RepID=A0A9D5H9R1_9LILI|nr:hypothetical protein J5N97_025140 [Dioscorea zingiberensis]